jgi:hypothetical protein
MVIFFYTYCDDLHVGKLNSWEEQSGKLAVLACMLLSLTQVSNISYYGYSPCCGEVNISFGSGSTVP